MAPKITRITLADGQTVDVIPTLQDTLAFETTLRKNRSWGGLGDNGLKLVSFRAWNAAKRTGKTTLSWDEFTTGDTAAISVESIDPADDEDADPDAENLEVAGVGLDTAVVVLPN